MTAWGFRRHRTASLHWPYERPLVRTRYFRSCRVVVPRCVTASSQALERPRPEAPGKNHSSILKAIKGVLKRGSEDQGTSRSCFPCRRANEARPWRGSGRFGRSAAQGLAVRAALPNPALQLTRFAPLSSPLNFIR